MRVLSLFNFAVLGILLTLAQFLIGGMTITSKKKKKLYYQRSLIILIGVVMFSTALSLKTVALINKPVRYVPEPRRLGNDLLMYEFTGLSVLDGYDVWLKTKCTDYQKQFPTWKFIQLSERTLEYNSVLYEGSTYLIGDSASIILWLGQR